MRRCAPVLEIFPPKHFPFGSNEPIIKAKKARRYGPGYQGYPLFGAVHLGELEAVAVCILLTARWYRRSPERTRRRILWGVTVLLLADEAVLVIAMLATGQWNWSYLPLHLCSIHIFL